MIMKEGAIDALDVARELTNRAVAIMKGAPFNRHFPYEELCSLKFENGKFVLFWPGEESDYDGGYNITIERIEIPQDKLFLTDIEFANWQIKEKHAAKELQKAETARRDEERKKAEVVEYERLKLKYGAREAIDRAFDTLVAK